MNSVPQTPSIKSRRRLWPRFTLRVLLALVTLIAVGLGIWTHRAREQRRIVDRINAVGGSVCYERDGPAAPQQRSAVIEWLAESLGRDFFEGVVAAGILERELLPDVVELGRVERLQIFCDDLEDRDIALLARGPAIEVLNLGVDFENSLTKVTDRSLVVLARMPKLRVLHVRGVGLSEAGIDALAASPTLEVLDIGSCAADVDASDFDEIKRRDRIKSLLVWRNGANGTEAIIARW